jgi:hypothetical protein
VTKATVIAATIEGREGEGRREREYARGKDGHGRAAGKVRAKKQQQQCPPSRIEIWRLCAC